MLTDHQAMRPSEEVPTQMSERKWVTAGKTCLKHRVQDALGRDIKCRGSALSCVQPIHGPLPVSILAPLWDRAVVCQAVPELPDDETRVCCGHIVRHMTPTEALDIVKSGTQDDS